MIIVWKHFVKDYFIFSRKERTGVIFIVGIVMVLIFIPFLFPYFSKKPARNYKEFENEIARLEVEPNDTTKHRTYTKNFDNEFYDDYSLPKEGHEYISAEVFYFDPNTTSAEDWKRLGLKPKTIATIQKYLSKGGRFNKPGEIGKIWGLTHSDARRLIPYVRIKTKSTEAISFQKREYPKTPGSYKDFVKQPIDVNMADTNALISLPGIGSKLSQRIVAFRDKLGGFYSVNQVGETYLLPDSTFQKIKLMLVINDATVKQININSASVEEMKSHPYLRYNLANAIFHYRQQHGNFNSVEEIKKIMIVTDDSFQKIVPYLSIR